MLGQIYNSYWSISLLNVLQFVVHPKRDNVYHIDDCLLHFKHTLLLLDNQLHQKEVPNEKVTRKVESGKS